MLSNFYHIADFSYSQKCAKNKYNRIPLIRTLVIRYTNHPDRIGPSVKFVENSIKLSCLETTGFRIKCSTVLYEGRTERHEQLYFACELGIADEGETSIACIT